MAGAVARMLEISPTATPAGLAADLIEDATNSSTHGLNMLNAFDSPQRLLFYGMCRTRIVAH